MHSTTLHEAAALAYAGAAGASRCLPRIIKAFGLSTLQTGMLNFIPFGVAARLAQVNAIGNLAGFVGSAMLGAIKDGDRQFRTCPAADCAGRGARLRDALTAGPKALTLSSRATTSRTASSTINGRPCHPAIPSLTGDKHV